MNITDYITNKIGSLSKGYVFTYKDFITEPNKKEAVIKALNRMAAGGKIKKLSKGRFYKPKTTAFGTLEPEYNQIVKDLLISNGKITGYVTGYGINNSLRLTTQLSNIIQIGKNQTRPELKRGMYKIRFIKQKNTITKENIPLLQLLDAIRFVKNIPDAGIDFLCTRFKALLNELNESELNIILRLAQKYPPSTRALLGALLENINKETGLENLKNSLNPITTYKLNIPERSLPNQSNWNIL